MAKLAAQSIQDNRVCSSQMGAAGKVVTVSSIMPERKW